MQKSIKIAQLYVASLQAISLIHRNAHWLSKGNSFYGDHLLFERVYTSASENADAAAEKFVGLFGEECLDYEAQANFINKVMLTYKNPSEDLVTRSLSVERAFIKLSQEFYKTLESEGVLSLGCDDLIMSIASQREEAIYLLNQRSE